MQANSVKQPKTESHASLSTEECTNGSTPQECASSRPADAVMHGKELHHSQRQHAAGAEYANWDIAVICCVATMFCTAMFCTTGLFYVYFMEAFGVNREAASWPSTTMGVAMSFSGIAVTLFQRCLTVFEIGLIGSVFLWAGVIASAFVPGMELMTLCLGALFGLGDGIMDNTIAVTIGIFFRKHRGIAMGVKDSGRTLSVLIFPSVVSKLNAEYGFRGALLICGALLLNVTALMLMLRRPQLTRRGVISADSDNNVGNFTPSVSTTKDCKLSAANPLELEAYTHGNAGKYQPSQEPTQDRLALDNSEHSMNNMVPVLRDSDSQPKEENACVQGNVYSSNLSAERSDADAPLHGIGDLNTRCSSRRPIQIFHLGAPILLEPSSSLSLKVADGEASAKKDTHSVSSLSLKHRAKSSCGEMQTLLADPKFYILVFQQIVITYWAVMNRSIGVDYALDKEVTTAHAELMATYAAATDLLLGHVAIPFLADRACLKRSVLAALTYALLSATLIASTFAHGIAQFLPPWVAASFLLAAAVSFSPVLTADRFGARRVPIVWGASGLISGPLLLATPSITGFFRDSMGSYDHLIHLVAALAGLAALLVLLLPFSGNRNGRIK